MYLGSFDINNSGVTSNELPRFSVSGLFELFINLVEVLQTQVEEFRDINIYILLDEYERIEEHLKIVINSIIRSRNEFLKLK
ncbi:unnamed protein product, partial [marine sediment metagenome]